MNHLKLTTDKLELNAINDLVADNSCGAISMFVGTTRDHFENKKVLCLEYEAYEPMALKIMTKICEDMRSKWSDIKNIAIYHRLGVVPVKEASVVIAVSSPHRQTSLLSVQFAIDELKKSVPIWKKEKYEDNDAAWKENKECSTSRRYKRPKLNYEACTLEKQCIRKSLIQITADENELTRRIQTFIEKKREENDLNNVLDFTNTTPENMNQEETCARVNSVVIKRKDSKGHLRVQRVQNEDGPQTNADYMNALDKLTSGNQMNIKNEPEDCTTSVPFGIAERLENVEKYFNIIPKASQSVYKRIKTIEDRITFLESISPEYHHFMNPKVGGSKKISKKTYSVDDVDTYIEKVREKINSKDVKA